jgi:hypothetical protein
MDAIPGRAQDQYSTGKWIEKSYIIGIGRKMASPIQGKTHGQSPINVSPFRKNAVLCFSGPAGPPLGGDSFYA